MKELLEKLSNRVILTPDECVQIAEWARAVQRGYFTEMKRAHEVECKLEKCRAVCEDDHGCCVLCHHDVCVTGHSENCGLFVESPGAQESREPDCKNSGTGFVKSEAISAVLGCDAYWVGGPRK